NNNKRKPQNKRNGNRPNNNNNFQPRRQQVPDIKAITYTEGITVGELAEKVGRQASDIIKSLFMEGKMVTINSPLE
ncbi:translation initiation factor IF-2 N-terminal domain-containing protein, partial [Acinetobacter pittii]|uniref:translation initiation factor IF-2 N-terminal domain-containing protein n=1 Tax=Acinetobacter pittii TaxID=48296 RepID=UPI002813F65B